MWRKSFKLLFTGFIYCAFSAAYVAATPLSAAKDIPAYEILENAGYGIESPDNAHNPSVCHITAVYDEELKRYVFAFTLHALIDDDRGIKSITDRQRVEIKTYQKSPPSMIANEGDTLIIRYKMKLPLNFKTTNKFCHLHQLKGMDNAKHTADVKHPLITLTACSTKKQGQQLQLRYFDRTTRQMSVKATANLREILGEWVEIAEKVTFGKNPIAKNNGSYEISIIRLKDGREILYYGSTSLNLWQTECAGLRPKWGIYRSLGENKSLAKYLRDEEVRFVDFDVEKY